MEVYCLKDRMPPNEVMGTGEQEVWWWNREDFRWELGNPLLMNSDSIGTVYTHWAPKESLPVPDELEEWEFDWREEFDNYSKAEDNKVS